MQRALGGRTYRAELDMLVVKGGHVAAASEKEIVAVGVWA